MKFIWAILLAFFTVFGQKAAVPVQASATPVAIPFDTAGFKLRQEIEALRNEVKQMTIQNENTREDARATVNHVDYILAGMFGVFILFGLYTRSSSNKEAENLKHGLQLDQKEKLGELQKTIQTQSDSLVVRFETESKATEKRLKDDLSGMLNAETKLLGENLGNLVGHNSREIRDMRLAHQLFRISVYLKIDKPKLFCEALGEYYADALALGDHGETAKAYMDVVDRIRIFISVYIRKSPSIKTAHVEQLRKIITAIGTHLESDPTKTLDNLDKIKPLKVFEFGNKENVWEHWIVDDLDIITGDLEVAAAIAAEEAEGGPTSE